jgi:nitrogen-specific signal transduction histidine kinase
MAREADTHIRGVFVEISSQRRLQELSMSMATMEAASSLAAGVAHDFNNLLTVLVGNLYLVADKVRADPAAYESVKRARDAARRGADLTRALLGCARGGDPETSTVDVRKVLRNLVPLLSAALGSRAKLKTDIPPDVSPVDVNSAQLESVITNLVINARDAIGKSAGGTVSISLRNCEIASDHEVNVPSGRYVELSVSDDGCGMPESVAQRAFEPFFTTKPRGAGSGLGLAMVRRFAEHANGAVLLRTVENVGTTVTCLLPVTANDVAETSVRTMPLSKLPSGHETILAISRDAEIRLTVEQILGALGYEVIAKSVFDVLSVNDLAAIVLDDNTLSSELAKIGSYLRQAKRRVGIVVIGNKTAELTADCVQIQKPFNLMDLSRAVRRAVDGA